MQNKKQNELDESQKKPITLVEGINKLTKPKSKITTAYQDTENAVMLDSPLDNSRWSLPASQRCIP